MCRANKEEIYIPYGVGICGHVAKTKETINLKDAYEVVICNHNSILSYYPDFKLQVMKMCICCYQLNYD